VIMRMRREEAAKLMQINTGHMHVPKTGPRCRRGRENILLHAAEENRVVIGISIVLSVVKMGECNVCSSCAQSFEIDMI